MNFIKIWCPTLGGDGNSHEKKYKSMIEEK